MSTNKKITELPELTELNLADDDVLAIVDVSAGTTNKVQKSVLASALSGVSVVNASTPLAVNQTTGEVTVSISATPSFGTVDFTADTSTGDNAAVGYTVGEGIVITGQGNTNDITLKNDADAVVLKVPTGTTNVTVTGVASAASFTGSGVGLTAGTTPITTLDIDGGTDIGAAIVDADLFIVDDAAGGTNRKATASRLKTYINAGDYSDPLTTRGDVVKRGASATERLAIGSANTVFTTDGTDPAWSTVTNAMLAGSIDLASKVTGVLPVANGGTAASSLTDGGVLLGSGTGAVTAMAVLTNGQMIVGDGSGDPVAESGATLRTSIGVGTGDNLQVTNLTATGAFTSLGIDDNASTTAIAISADEQITLPLQPSFMGRSNTLSNITGDGTAYTILYPTERFDVGANYSSPDYTAPITGKYIITLSIEVRGLASDHTDLICNIVTTNRTYNVTRLNPSAISVSGIMSFSGSMYCDMDAADTATTTLKVSGGSKVVDIDEAYWSVALIG